MQALIGLSRLRQAMGQPMDASVNMTGNPPILEQNPTREPFGQPTPNLNVVSPSRGTNIAPQTNAQANNKPGLKGDMNPTPVAPQMGSLQTAQSQGFFPGGGLMPLGTGQPMRKQADKIAGL